MPVSCFKHLEVPSRQQPICPSGGSPISAREGDLDVRTGSRLTVVECFSYELPLDFEVRKPSAFEKRNNFLSRRSIKRRRLPSGSGWSGRVPTSTCLEPKKSTGVVSPFVEFAWEIDDMFFDERGLPRVLQAEELLDHLTNGRMPVQRLVRCVREFRGVKPAGRRC